MKLSYLIPEDGTYEFFHQMVEPLVNAGIKVLVNGIDPDTDLILAGILPCTPKWIRRIHISTKPYVLWHWDYYSSTDYSQTRWSYFLDFLHRATAIWSCTYEVARELKEYFGLDSDMVPAWVDKEELWQVEPVASSGKVLFAASGCGFGKRPEWVERSCSLHGLPYTILKGQSLPRREYKQALYSCKLYVMPAFEESNGTIPAMEAAVYGVNLLMGDLPSSREVFGNTVRYFDTWNFRDFHGKVRECYDAKPYGEATQQRILNCYNKRVVSKVIIERLGQAYARIQSGSR